MASGKGPAGAGPSQEFVVRVPQESSKKHSILKFHHSLRIDLTKSGAMKMNRENNLREYRQAYNMDMAPKFGAGSEFGREQREEARRKKYGIYRKRYNPEDQPWHMSLGEGKDTKKYKGVKEGGIADNVSYFVFTQCPDGAFEASPVDDWYHFTPQIKHKVLTSEEAEEEFSRRDHTLNYFSIMVRKRLNKEEEDDTEDNEKKGKKSKAKKGLLLTDEDDWAILSDGDVEEYSDAETEKKDAEKSKKDKGKGKKKKPKNQMKTNSDDEALEESDSFDEGGEIDYMTDSDSNDEDMYEDKNRGDREKYKDQGVEDEEGLKNLVESGEEDEEDAENKEDEEEEEEKEKTGANDSDSDSSGDSSGSDSDPEKDVSSALFLQKKKEEKKKVLDTEARSRSSTPTEDKGKKRKAETESPLAKKVKVEPTISPSVSSSNLALEGITEDAVRRYLLRKPMTTKDLVQKFKNTGLSKDQLVNNIAKILKRIDPEKKNIKGKLYLSIKKKDAT